MTVTARPNSTALRARRKETPSPGARILLIEDNRSDVFLATHMLAAPSGDTLYEIVDVPSLSRALEALEAGRFSAILLDLGLSDSDGVASIAALKSVAQGVPILVYSGTYDPRLRHDALMCGARHYLVKGRESAFSLQFMIRQALEGAPAVTD